MFKDILIYVLLTAFFQHEAKLLTCNTERLKPKDVFVNFCASESFAYISKVARWPLNFTNLSPLAMR